MQSYRELIVWQKSIELVTKVYELVKLLPKEEVYALSSQIRRAAVSIPSNIAEGHDRNSDKEFVNFLYIARGSLAELETQIYIAVNLKYFSNEQTNIIFQDCSEIGRMLNALIKKAK